MRKLPTSSKLYYSNFHSKKKFGVNKINTKNDFDEVYQSCKKGEYIFRGVNEAKYKLLTSLQRYWIVNDMDKTGSSPLKFTIQMLKDFDNNGMFNKWFKKFTSQEPTYYSKLSFLRHHGAPVSLMDFSTSVDVALYFCFENSSNDLIEDEIDNYCSLYIMRREHPVVKLDPKKIWIEFWRESNSFKGNFKEQYLGIGEIKITQPRLYKKIHDKFLLFYTQRLLDFKLNGIDDWYQKSSPYSLIEDKEVDGIKWHILNNLRITSQDGLFLDIMPMGEDWNNSLEELFVNRIKSLREKVNLSKGEIVKAERLHYDNFTCINIHKSLKEYVLDKIDVDEAVIYPNSDKISESVLTKTMINI